jgi:hypothetical protein
LGITNTLSPFLTPPDPPAAEDVPAAVDVAAAELVPAADDAAALDVVLLDEPHAARLRAATEPIRARPDQRKRRVHRGCASC